MAHACLRCGSKAIIPDAVVVSGGLGYGRVRVGLKRVSKYRFGPVDAEVTALVCSVCGHVELHLADAAPVVGRYRMQVKAAVEKAEREGSIPTIVSCPRCLSILPGKLECEACGWSFNASTASGGTA